MGSSQIDALKTTLGIGARANKYRVTINGTGTNFVFGEEGDLLCKSASIPGRSFADIEVWNQGRLTVVAGDAQFDGTWTVTFMDTEEHKIRTQFIDWMEYIDSAVNHTRGAVDHSSYMNDAILEQLSTIDNSVTATYTLLDVYPKSISDSSLSDDSSDLVEFSIEFNYSSWIKS